MHTRLNDMTVTADSSRRVESRLTAFILRIIIALLVLFWDRFFSRKARFHRSSLDPLSHSTAISDYSPTPFTIDYISVLICCHLQVPWGVSPRIPSRVPRMFVLTYVCLTNYLLQRILVPKHVCSRFGSQTTCITVQ